MEKKLDMSQFLSIFRDETGEHLEKLNQGLLSLEKEPENEEEKGSKIEFAEAFEISEYGYMPPMEQLKKLFPFYSESGE